MNITTNKGASPGITVDAGANATITAAFMGTLTVVDGVVVGFDLGNIFYHVTAGGQLLASFDAPPAPPPAEQVAEGVVGEEG